MFLWISKSLTAKSMVLYWAYLLIKTMFSVFRTICLEIVNAIIWKFTWPLKDEAHRLHSFFWKKILEYEVSGFSPTPTDVLLYSSWLLTVSIDTCSNNYFPNALDTMSLVYWLLLLPCSTKVIKRLSSVVTWLIHF